MDARLLFPNEYLGAPDLKGQDVTLTIARVVQEKLRTQDGDEIKPIIYFKEMEDRHAKDPDQLNKKLVLNKTNATSIMGLHGNETDEWTGEKVILFATTCQAFGQTVDCIRIRRG